MSTRGRFISFEGVDGAGKSSHIKRVADWLGQHGIEFVQTREPGGTPCAEKIRDLVLHQDMSVQSELLLMYAARIEHIETLIKPNLERGVWVLSDRFEDSSFAYQGNSSEQAWQRCEDLSRWALQGFKPDLSFLFDLPIAVSIERIQKRNEASDRFELRSVEYFEKVRGAFLQRARQEPHRLKVIDSCPPEAVVGENVIRQLSDFFNNLAG